MSAYLRAAFIDDGAVVLSADEAYQLRGLLRMIFAQHVYAPTEAEIAAGAEPPTDFPGSVMGRTFPEWLAMLGGPS